MKIIDIALKDLVQSFRSLFAIGMSVIAPLMLTGLLYFAFGNLTVSKTPDLPAVKVGIVNADQLPADSPLKEPLGNSIRSMFFDDSVKTWISASDYADEASARAAVDKQEVGVAMVIPASFSADLLAGIQDTPILMIQDPTLSITPLIVRNMLTSFLDGVSGGGIAYQTISERQQALGIPADVRLIPVVLDKYSTWYANFQRDMFHNPGTAALVLTSPAQDESQSSGLINIIGMIMAGQMIFFAFFTGANAMMTILREQEEGTLARLFTTPTGRTQILAGKFLAVVLMVVLQGVTMMVAGRLIFGVQWGNPGAAALAFAGQVLASTGLGVLLISFVKDTRQGGTVLGGGLTALGMLGGLFTVSLPNAPKILTSIANFTPQGWVLKAWNTVLNGASAVEVLLPFVMCLAMGAVMFAIGAILFRRRFA
jgi:ABC-2 type transport system permease protein